MEFRCSKDGSPMYLVLESEDAGGAKKVAVYYRCPVCGNRIEVERMDVKREGDRLLINRVYRRQRAEGAQ
ncbi:MAG: hypothetical protein ABWK00_05075 [Desulfurococcaceae archaeon]